LLSFQGAKVELSLLFSLGASQCRRTTRGLGLKALTKNQITAIQGVGGGFDPQIRTGKLYTRWQPAV
jgi:hypothetical protein